MKYPKVVSIYVSWHQLKFIHIPKVYCL
jgi:hypothetical protein